MNYGLKTIVFALLLCSLSLGQVVNPNATTGSRPQILKFVAPAYPRKANDARMMGTVITRLTVGTGGAVTRVDLVSGHPFFAVSVLDALKQWKFVASQKEYTVDVTTRFEFYSPDRCSDSDGKPLTPETLVSAELPTDVLIRTTEKCWTITTSDPAVR